ncbi:hypothetical protein LTR17_010321 [Elasticomyces elasticus]|nr:hypothetical protein LTR17_010321 [Elasticomyces elasticus]
MAEPTLLGIPPEMRNRIFELVLVEKHANRLYEDTWGEHCIRPDLLRTNRQIRDEATPVWYGANIFINLPKLRMMKHLRMQDKKEVGRVDSEEKKEKVLRSMLRFGGDHLSGLVEFPLISEDGGTVWCTYWELSQFKLVETDDKKMRWMGMGRGYE